MSELINNSAKRLEAIYNFASRLVDGENGKMLIEHHKQVIDTISPMEAMQVLDNLLVNGFPNEVVKTNVGKIINVFYKSLSTYQWNKPSEGHFLNYLMLENREVEIIMTDLKSVIKTFFNSEKPNIETFSTQLRVMISKLKAYELHYIKKENILFPYIEKAFPEYRCLQVMWSFHDDFRKSIKTLDSILLSEQPDKEQLNKELGKLFFVVMPIIFREEQIVFPVALSAIPEKSWAEMLQQSFEVGWCYIQDPIIRRDPSISSFNISGNVNLGTGALSPEQLILLLNHLPVDITFVDENDEVRYFSGAKHRIFPRSQAIIGRKVQNCHPPESVHVVNEIIEAFRSGQKEHADFWIQMKGMFIHIRYFALRNEKGNYKGIIEVSQDATEIRTLQGDRRLLDWKL